jgi:3-oxoacyl-[acyl-carrier protein] reductase
MGKTIIVTGASRGIGREIAKRLAADGFSIVVNFAGNAAKAAEVVTEIESAGGTALALKADVANEKEVEQLFEQTAAQFGSDTLHAVVHSAGIMTLSKIVDGNVAEFDKIIATNLRGAFLVLGQAARHVAEGGRILALSTSVIGVALPGYGPYIASKAGVEGLVRVLANELRGRNVCVNAVAPGPIATELFLNGKTSEQIGHLAKMAPLERLGKPVDIAGVVAFLIGPDGGWINGQVVRANGGFV